MARVVDLAGSGMAVSCDMTPRILIAALESRPFDLVLMDLTLMVLATDQG